MRRFEYWDQKSNKFWEIEGEGAEVTTRWGRIDSAGQCKTKVFASEAKASAEVEKQIRTKVGKGYAETTAGAAGTGRATATGDPAATHGGVAKGGAGGTASLAGTGSAGDLAGDLADGASTLVSGSGSAQYTLSNTGGVYACTCPAWRNQSLAIDRRTCKHLRKFRGEAAEEARLGALPVRSSASANVDAPPLLLAHRWEQQDPRGWLMSEKLDGVRAYWDGEGFVSRLGNAYLAPEWFVAALPKFPLDGELFGGRGRFQETVSIARRADAGEAWRALSFVIFDAPEIVGGFEIRLAAVAAHFEAAPSDYAEVLDHSPCGDEAALRAELARIEGLGGEGVMLRRPGSAYVAGRSETLLKVKSFFDCEARVTGHQPGAGRHLGRLGALRLELPDGTAFKAGTGLSDAEREQPPAVGEIVTVRYQELTNAGVPRFPIYVGRRVDFDWVRAVAAVAVAGSSAVADGAGARGAAPSPNSE